MLILTATALTPESTELGWLPWLVVTLVTVFTGAFGYLLKSYIPKQQAEERKERATMRDEMRVDGEATRLVLGKVADSLSSVSEQLAASREQSRAGHEGCLRAQDVLTVAAARVDGASDKIETAAIRVEAAAATIKGDIS